MYFLTLHINSIVASSQVPGVHITPRANLQWSVKGLEAGTFQFRGQAVVLVSLPQLGISEGGQAVPGTGQLQKYDFWGNSLGAPFTMLPPRLSHSLSQSYHWEGVDDILLVRTTSAYCWIHELPQVKDGRSSLFSLLVG